MAGIVQECATRSKAATKLPLQVQIGTSGCFGCFRPGSTNPLRKFATEPWQTPKQLN